MMRFTQGLELGGSVVCCFVSVACVRMAMLLRVSAVELTVVAEKVLRVAKDQSQEILDLRDRVRKLEWKK